MLSWDNTMSVGVKQFDAHHKRIIELINKLQISLARGEDTGVTYEVLTAVANYTIYHFFVEEELMQKFSYPGYPQHKAEHLALTKEAMRLLEDTQARKADMRKDVLNFLKAWLKNHILGTDKAYTAFFRDRGVA